VRLGAVLERLEGVRETDRREQRRPPARPLARSSILNQRRKVGESGRRSTSSSKSAARVQRISFGSRSGSAW
jgi:hypothetical protein